MTLELRKTPSHTLDGIRPPKQGFPYFEHADRFRFEPEATEYSAVNAWWLADATFNVYGNAEFIEDTLARSPLPELGYRLDWLGTREVNRGIVLANETAMIFVFRGTQIQVRNFTDFVKTVVIDESDLLIDSQIFPAAFRTGGKVHSGFLRAFQQVSERFDEIVQGKTERQKLWLTGHSLGGALATLAAAHLGRGGYQGLYTYGSPRVGNNAFTKTLPAESHFRVVHRDDWVATQPPDFMGYVHTGNFTYLMGEPRKPFLESFLEGASDFSMALSNMAREQKVNFGDFPLTVPAIVDHAPAYYATVLWNALVETIEPKS